MFEDNRLYQEPTDTNGSLISLREPVEDVSFSLFDKGRWTAVGKDGNEYPLDGIVISTHENHVDGKHTLFIHIESELFKKLPIRFFGTSKGSKDSTDLPI